MERTPRAEWERRVAKWRRSGMSTAEFASQHGLNASTLSYWRWKLGAAQTPPVTPRRTGKSRRRPRPSSDRERPIPEDGGATSPFASVDIVAFGGGETSIELVLMDGIRVRVPLGFDEGTLERVLELLRGGTR